MDEPTQMQLHDLTALRRCCDDGLAYLDRLIASTPSLPRRDLTRLREHRLQLGKISVSADQVAQRIRDAAGGV